MDAKVSPYVDLLLTIFGWRDAIDISGLKDVMDDLLSTLSATERLVLDRSFGLTSGSMLTYEEIANELKTTREKVEEHIDVALRKLRHPSRSRRLKAFIDEITPREAEDFADTITQREVQDYTSKEIREALDNVSRQDILRAMAKFDSDFPNTNDYDRWLDNGKYKYALEHTRYYPPKKVMSEATGIPIIRFYGGSGTYGVNRYFKREGFKIIPKPVR